jgi:hypothetical protein
MAQIRTHIDLDEVEASPLSCGPHTRQALVAVARAALKLDACGPDRDSTYAEFLEEFDRFREALAPFKEDEQ